MDDSFWHHLLCLCHEDESGGDSPTRGMGLLQGLIAGVHREDESFAVVVLFITVILAWEGALSESLKTT
jgi:hypothetical protein